MGRGWHPPETVCVCDGWNRAPSPRVSRAMALAVSGTTRCGVWLKLASVFTPSLRSGTLFLGSIPLKYSRISVLSAPYCREDRVMPAEKRAAGRVEGGPQD